jgi:hypothetical protein
MTDRQTVLQCAPSQVHFFLPDIVRVCFTHGIDNVVSYEELELLDAELSASFALRRLLRTFRQYGPCYAWPQDRVWGQYINNNPTVLRTATVLQTVHLQIEDRACGCAGLVPAPSRGKHGC